MDWEMLVSTMPSWVEVFPDGDEALVKAGDKELNIVYDEENNSFTLNGKTLHFEDVDFEVIGTLLVPYVLQELDGERRI